MQAEGKVGRRGAGEKNTYFDCLILQVLSISLYHRLKPTASLCLESLDSWLTQGCLLAWWGSEFSTKWLGWWEWPHTVTPTISEWTASNQPLLTPFLDWVCGLTRFAIQPLSPFWCPVPSWTSVDVPVWCCFLKACYFCCSVDKPYQTLFNPMDCSAPGFPVLHHLLEFVQTHVCWVGDAIQPSHPLPPSSPFAFNLSQHQGLFQWISS